MRVTLFMTRGMSLAEWDACGLLHRELALYDRFHRAGIEVGIVSYGHRDARLFGSSLPGIRILENKWRLPRPIYERLIPWLHSAWLDQTDIVKSNQTDGADVALRAARSARARFVSRCGFMLSTNSAREHGNGSPWADRAKRLERSVFTGADHIIVTTDDMAADIRRRLPDCGKKITVIPNYVDTNTFRPMVDATHETDLLFIGRLSREKNLEALLTAVSRTSHTLSIVGDGELAGSLKTRFGDMDGRLRWLGIQANNALPGLMAGARAYIQPSLYEGHPKTIIEAMAAGKAVIATDVPGINTVLDHGKTGWLTTPASDDLQSAIDRVLSDPDLRMSLGRNARAKAAEAYGLDVIAAREIDLYAALSGLTPE